MKVLSNSKECEAILVRIINGVDAEFTCIDLKSPTELCLSFNVQDEARGFDWVGITFMFYGVSAAQLISENEVHLLDMSDGFTLLLEKGEFGFAIGSYKTMSHLHDARFFVTAESVKFNEHAPKF